MAYHKDSENEKAVVNNRKSSTQEFATTREMPRDHK